MSEDQKKQLEQQLWNIANTLRGKMNDENKKSSENSELSNLVPGTGI